MKTNLKWTQGMQFEASGDSNQIIIDAKSPIGKGTGLTPKELVAIGVGGCTSMDVVALLKKHKQSLTSFEVEIDSPFKEGSSPKVFEKIIIIFNVKGEIDPSILLESVRLSQTKYCGVSKMLVASTPIEYVVKLNNMRIGEGAADFN